MNPSLRQATRMLALVPYLQSRGAAPVEELAREFSVKPAQIRKDMKLLAMTGPGAFGGELIDLDYDALDEDDVAAISNAEFMRRPLRLTRAEGAALVTALRVLRSTSSSHAEAVDSALAKIQSAIDLQAAADSSVDVIAKPLDQTIVATLEAALTARQVVHLTYATESRDERTERDVEPIALRRVDGEHHLYAWCQLAGDFRQFRVDRIESAVDTGRMIEVDRGQAPDDDQFSGAPDSPSALITLAPAAAWVSDQYDFEVVDTAADGSITGRFRSYDLSWLRRLVLRFGGDLKVLEPASLAAEVADHARRALNAYDGTIT